MSLRQTVGNLQNKLYLEILRKSIGQIVGGISVWKLKVLVSYEIVCFSEGQ